MANDTLVSLDTRRNKSYSNQIKITSHTHAAAPPALPSHHGTVRPLRNPASTPPTTCAHMTLPAILNMCRRDPPSSLPPVAVNSALPTLPAGAPRQVTYVYPSPPRLRTLQTPRAIHIPLLSLRLTSHRPYSTPHGTALSPLKPHTPLRCSAPPFSSPTVPTSMPIPHHCNCGLRVTRSDASL